jgi:hypothetical protein
MKKRTESGCQRKAQNKDKNRNCVTKKSTEWRQEPKLVSMSSRNAWPFMRQSRYNRFHTKLLDSESWSSTSSSVRLPCFILCSLLFPLCYTSISVVCSFRKMHKMNTQWGSLQTILITFCIWGKQLLDKYNFGFG